LITILIDIAIAITFIRDIICYVPTRHEVNACFLILKHLLRYPSVSNFSKSGAILLNDVEFADKVVNDIFLCLFELIIFSVFVVKCGKQFIVGC
jgi:hypothetical protein